MDQNRIGQKLVSFELADAGMETDSRYRPASSSLPSVSEDDRYPGSFFRIPGVPMPGKTTWSLAK